MRKIFFLTIMASLLVLMNTYFITSFLHHSHTYPFSRILLGDELTAAIGKAIQREPFGARKIEPEGISEKTLKNSNREIRAAGLHIALIDRAGNTFENIYHSKSNDTLLWFFAFMLLIGNVHIVFSITVFVFRGTGHQPKIFIALSFLQGIWYFFAAEYFFSEYFKTLFPISTVLLALAVLCAGYYLSGRRVSRVAAISFIICTLIFMLASMTSISPFSTRIKTVLIFIYFMIFAIASSANLLMNIVHTGDNYAIKNRLPSLYGIAISFIIPPALFAVSFLWELPFYVHYASLFSLALPFFMGQNIFYRNLFSSRYFFLRSSVLFAVNILTALVMSSLLFLIARRAASFPRLIFWLLLIFIVFTALIAASRKLRRTLINALILDRANHSRSLQNIEILAATPEALDFKIERIFTEISLILGTSEIHLLLFGEVTELPETVKSGLLEKLSKDSDLAQYFSSERGAVFSYELIRWSPLEERIVRFMEKQRCLLAVPIFSEKTVIGALLLGEKQNGELYFSHDISYLETIALQIRQMIENDRLLNNYIARRRFEMELDIASFVQSRLFPRKAPVSGKISISFYNRPYLKVTGDYFDFIEIDKKNTAIIIGDISGHGLAAAMILSMISSTFHTLLKEKISIEGVIEEINYLLNNRYRGTELITLFAGIYNSSTGEMRYINAGHIAPVLLRKSSKQFSTLEGRSKIIGADPHALYLASSHNFEKGDELFLFTDGATEIYDEKTGHGVTEEDIIESIKKNINLDIEEKINVLIEKINAFNHAIKDDITLIAIRFN